MKTLLSALALAAAVPAVAYAQAAPAPSPTPAPAHEKECCCKKMDRPMACCDMHGDKGDHAEGSADPHAGHKMSPQ